MIIKRKIEQQLSDWLESENTKPIILRGARQVGKTFVVNQFAKKFNHFIQLNLEKPRERELFSNYNGGQQLFERILLYKGIRADRNKTLLFIDEIQNSSKAITSLRYLYEDIKGLRVIAAGSLLEVFSGREGFSFPVGRVQSYFLYPVNFTEYLQHTNSVLAEKLSSLDFDQPTDTHQLLLNRFYEYSFVGGMPEAVSVFHHTKSYSSIRDIYDSILIGYIEDVEKYSNLARAKYLSYAIDRAPLYVAERITYEKFGESHFRSREMSEAFNSLEKALIVFRARPSSSLQIPVIEKPRKSPKLFFLDIGLVNYRIGINYFFDRKKPLSAAFRGKLAEQVVAQELVALNNTAPRLCFWVRERGTAEIDFIYRFRDYLIPIEVKSGATGKMKSLNLFMEKSDHPYAVRIYSGKSQIDKIHLPSGKKYFLFSIPYYFLSKFDQAIDWFISSY